MRGIVLLLAAGEGTRIGTGEPKAFLDVAGVPVIRRAFEAAMGAELVHGVVVAAPAGYERRVESLVPPEGDRSVTVVTGGSTRQASAAAALAAAPATDVFLVHDAARARAPASVLDAVRRELDNCEAACPGRPVVDTIKVVDDGFVSSTLDRTSLIAVETPQGVRADLYRRAHEAAVADGFVGTDDVSLVERLGVGVRIVPSVSPNPKITFAADVAFAEALLGAER
jgi:2-C-methyl-D-erythritol 4-phosphate cytidylyltransferase